MNSKKISFLNNEKISLSARLEMPVDMRPRAFAIFAHCFTCSKNLNAVTNISRALTGNGIAVLRFDFTGLGESEGDFSETNFSSNVDDLLAATAYLEHNYRAPSIMIGHSLGGAAVLLAASRAPSIQAVVTIGAPADPPHVTKLFKEDINQIKTEGAAKVSLGGRPFTIKKQFIDDLEKNDLKETLKKMKKALLVLHSPQDNTVSIDNAKKIYEMAFHPKSFISLNGADHLLSNKEDSLYAGDIIASWAKRYITDELGKNEAPPTEDHVVSSTSDDGYTTQIKVDKHSLLADEPLEYGGKDLGPTPYGYLLTALGACTGMTLRMYADRKKWNLTEVKVYLDHEKVYAKDCEGCESKNGKIDKIQKRLEIIGDLNEEQRSKLLEIADKCPVHKTLHSEVKINTTLEKTKGSD